jgi:hypothetical protein
MLHYSTHLGAKDPTGDKQVHCQTTSVSSQAELLAKRAHTTKEVSKDAMHIKVDSRVLVAIDFSNVRFQVDHSKSPDATGLQKSCTIYWPAPVKFGAPLVTSALSVCRLNVSSIGIPLLSSAASIALHDSSVATGEMHAVVCFASWQHSVPQKVGYGHEWLVRTCMTFMVA